MQSTAAGQPWHHWTSLSVLFPTEDGKLPDGNLIKSNVSIHWLMTGKALWTTGSLESSGYKGKC